MQVQLRKQAQLQMQSKYQQNQSTKNIESRPESEFTPKTVTM